MLGVGIRWYPRLPEGRALIDWDGMLVVNGGLLLEPTANLIDRPARLHLLPSAGRYLRLVALRNPKWEESENYG